MRSWILAFLAGVLCLQQFSQLPATKWILIIICCVGIIYYCFKKYWRWLRLPVASALGFAWCLYYVHAQLSWKLPEEWEGKTVTISGYIASIPVYSNRGAGFMFDLKKMQFEKNSKFAHGLIRLTWRSYGRTIQVGDEWRLSVRLKKIYGTMNPGGFDYEAFALQEGIRANGYVVTQLDNSLISHHWYHHPIDRVRQYLKEKIVATVPMTQTSPWITALAIGERHDISQNDWQVLRNTGTNHLMAIAGLHIGFMAALAHFFVAGGWRRFPRLTMKVPALHAGAVAALLMALSYSAMAGFSIPTERACLMLAVFLVTLICRRFIRAWQAWCFALFCMLIWNPLNVLAESFWLSFGSVALIIYGVSGRILPTGLWWKWGRIQWVIAVGLIPLSIALFQQCSFVSFAANCIAIPWVAFIVVPLCLFGCFILPFSAKVGGIVLTFADKVLSVLWNILIWFAQLPGVVWYQHVPDIWIIIVAIMGILFLLAPIGFPGRYVGLIWLLPLGLYHPASPKQNDAWLTLLDVGQGLSAVIQTQHHVLVYDTGPRTSTSFDMGDSVVVPFLHTLGVKQVDMMVISHGDNDHIGGAPAVLHQFPVAAIKTSVPEKLLHGEYCLRGTSWNWDGVNFAFIYPTPEQLNLGNNSSCVLRITSNDKHILLTGDIEKFAEKMLVKNSLNDLPAQIVIAPHHGSKTSGLSSFIAGVNPQYVLFPLAYRNRYHFPHTSVKKSYQERGTKAYETAQTGAIQFQLSDSVIQAPMLYRQMHKHYWNN